jgi:hypothetical protein
MAGGSGDDVPNMTGGSGGDGASSMTGGLGGDGASSMTGGFGGDGASSMTGVSGGVGASSMTGGFGGEFSTPESKDSNRRGSYGDSQTLAGGMAEGMASHDLGPTVYGLSSKQKCMISSPLMISSCLWWFRRIRW